MKKVQSSGSEYDHGQKIGNTHNSGNKVNSL